MLETILACYGAFSLFAAACLLGWVACRWWTARKTLRCECQRVVEMAESWLTS